MTPEDARVKHLLESMPCVRKVNELIDSDRYPPRRTLFATRYFNRENEEVAYFIPDLQPQGRLVQFDPPRIWSEWALQEIGLMTSAGDSKFIRDILVDLIGFTIYKTGEPDDEASAWDTVERNRSK